MSVEDCGTGMHDRKWQRLRLVSHEECQTYHASKRKLQQNHHDGQKRACTSRLQAIVVIVEAFHGTTLL